MNYAHITAIFAYFSQVFLICQVGCARKDHWVLGLLFAWAALVCLAGTGISFKKYLKEPS